MSGYRFIAAEQSHYPVQVLCRVLGVVPSRYYAWYQRQAAPPPETDTCFEEAVKEVFYAHHRRYGTRRLRAEFQAKGHRVGRQRLRTALRRLGLRALQPKAYVPRTTDSTHGQRCAPNLLLEQAPLTHANQVWVSDITYLPLASGNWVYLCAFQDSFTRQVVGWHVMATMPEELITSALRRALLARQPAAGLIVHSDRGGQYIGQAYKKLLADAGAQWSQSRKAECLDNAQAESLWSRFKTEELAARPQPYFADLADARASVATYFDYYNYERRHSALAYQTPQSFYLQQLKNKSLNCPA
jgi:putative transposase